MTCYLRPPSDFPFTRDHKRTLGNIVTPYKFYSYLPSHFYFPYTRILGNTLTPYNLILWQMITLLLEVIISYTRKRERIPRSYTMQRVYISSSNVGGLSLLNTSQGFW